MADTLTLSPSPRVPLTGSSGAPAGTILNTGSAGAFAGAVSFGLHTPARRQRSRWSIGRAVANPKRFKLNERPERTFPPKIARELLLALAVVGLGFQGLASAQPISLETAPPVVVKTSPTAGATDVDPALNEIRVTFSKPMQNGSWSWTTWGEENFPELVGKPRYLPDGRTCVLTVKLEPDKFYATWLNSEKFKNFKDRDGRAAVPYLLTFTTRSTGGLVRSSADPAFGPAVEVVLPSPSGAKAELLDLDAGHRATSETFGRNDRETHAWIRANQLDVLGVVEKGQMAVLCMDMIAVPAGSNSWEMISASSVTTNWNLAQGESKTVMAISPVTDKTDVWFFRTREGGQGVLQIVGPSAGSDGVRIRYKLLSNATSSADSQSAVREIATQFASAIQERNNARLQALSTDAVVKGWTDAVVHFGDELRVRLNEVGEGFQPLGQIEEVLVEGDLAAVKTAQLKKPQAYLALFFCRTPNGWRNCCLQNSPNSKSLEQNFKEFVDREKAVEKLQAVGSAPTGQLLNDDQLAVIAWTDRQFRSYFDDRTFDGWSAEERAALETKSIDALSGPRTRDYYTAINTLGALRSTNALPRLREIAFERVDGNNRNRWMCVRVLGIMGDRQSIPDLITLVYHGNQNTHWWAQIALVQLTGQNFGGDWEAWGKWWNASGGQPPYNPEIIRWWEGQADTVEGLEQSLDENNRKFLQDVRSR